MVDEITRLLFPDYPDEKQVTEFYAALGRTISGWQLVETALCEVYGAAVKPGTPGAVWAAFHAVQTFKSKLTMTDVAVRFVLLDHTTVALQWADLFGQADTMNARRNDLVHFSVYTYFNERSKNRRIRLAPQVYDARFSAKLRKGTEYTINEVKQFGDRFATLSRELSDFSRKITALPQPPSSS